MQNRVFILVFALLCAKSSIVAAHSSNGFPVTIHTESSLNGVFFTAENTNLPFSRLVVEDVNTRLASNVLIISTEFRQLISLQNDDINLPIATIRVVDNLLVLEAFNEL
jgi:hypothetical protein